MTQIRVLPPHIANQIAAGEVVERPSSVVKELVENALDAGATNIVVEIENGGTDLIRVTDNGTGIAEQDCKTAFLRHATSKIATSEDLSRIVTLGFRGEALASIAAVSEVVLRTRTKDADQGTMLRVENGEILEQAPCVCAQGAAFEVRNLFANVPARLKFLKSVRTEAGYISDYVSRMMMAMPSVAFHLRNNGKTVYQTFGDGELKNVLLCVYGADILPHLREVDFDDGYLAISGYVGTESISRPNRLQQSLFLNGRYIRSFALSAAIQRAFDTRMMAGHFPFAVIKMRIASGEVDVNVHPTKMEVRFVDEQRIIRSMTAACHRALLVPNLAMQERQTSIPLHDGKEPETAHASPKPMPHIPELRKPLHVSAQMVREAAPNWMRTPPRPHISAVTISGDEPEEKPLFEENAENTDRIQPKAHLSSSEQPALTEVPYSLIGAAFQTYWIVQQGDTIFFIDQHAAHERCIYERLMKRELQTVAQPLLTPRSVLLSPLELDALQNNLSELEALGFSFSFPENGTVQMCSVPQVVGEPLTESYLHDALQQLTTIGTTSAKALKREAIIQSACKHAVKAGEPLTKAEIERLLLDYEREGIPMTCPHGRPVMVKMSKRELEKLFKRIV